MYENKIRKVHLENSQSNMDVYKKSAAVEVPREGRGFMEVSFAFAICPADHVTWIYRRLSVPYR